MAIKFSQFVVQTDASTLSHVVGYNGVDNIQITPTNFLNSLLTGTAGQVLFYDTTGVTGDSGFYWDNTNKRLGIGTTSPQRNLTIYESSGNAVLQLANNTSGVGASDGFLAYTDGTNVGLENKENGYLSLATNASEKMRITSAGNVGIGTTTPTSKLEVDGDMSVTAGGVILLPDNSFLRFGTSADATIYHDATDTYFKNFTGDLILQNNKDNADIIFQSDDGSGGVTNYIQIDGSELRTTFNKNIRLNDAIAAQFGGSNGMQIYHNNSNSIIQNITGNLTIRNDANDKDIIFQSDDGSGGVTTYFFLDGGRSDTSNLATRFPDGSIILLGSGTGWNDGAQIYHSGSNFYLNEYVGNIEITCHTTDGDIKFKSDDGSGGETEYFRVDGGITKTVFVRDTKHLDDKKALFGDQDDLQIYHNGTTNNSNIDNTTGDLYVSQYTDNGDIIFRSDDGSGGLAEYFRLDGSRASGSYTYTTRPDGGVITFGDTLDLRLWHDPNTNESYMRSYNNNLYIESVTADKDILFRADDGSGGVTEYFRVDGGSTLIAFSKPTFYGDGVKALFGNSSDLNIYHNGTNSLIENSTGDFYISNKHDDGDIIFFCDDGSGGTAQYFRVDGGAVETRFLKSTLHFDNVKAKFGDGDDLQIYHDGSHSYIQDTGTGVLKILGSGITMQNAVGSENMAVFTENDAVILYNNGVEKLRTIGSGVRITGVSEYANNTAALAGGLVVGDVYRTGDDLKIVH